MCDLCNGLTNDALMAQSFQRITTNKFTMFSVDGPTPWAYTVGLVESCDHPELVVTGLEIEHRSAALAGVAERVKKGERFDDSQAVADVAGLHLHVGAVHPDQWKRGRFNMWFAYYEWRGLQPAPSAVQLVWPLAPCPPGHQCECQPLLDRRPRHDVNRRRT